MQMSLQRGCCGGECSPYVGGVAVGIYATAVYLTASGLELGWIIESDDYLPSVAYVLTAEYFCSLFFALFLMVGLLLRNTKYLLVWLVLMMAFFFLECGLVLYMSLYHWGLSSPRGLAEFIFYVCRAVLNILSIVCIHWLQAAWQREAHVLQRLRTLHVGSLFSEVDASSTKADPEAGNVHFSHEIFYTASRCQESELLYMTKSNNPPTLVRSPSTVSTPPSKPNALRVAATDDCFCRKPGSSEFDASSFNEFLAWKINNHQQLQPHHHRKFIGSSSQSDIIPVSKSKLKSGLGGFHNPAFSDTQSLYSTRSLQRHMSTRSEPIRRVQSLGDISGQRSNIFVLKKLPQGSLEYLQKQGSIVVDDADSNSSHSIRDVAL